MRVQATCWTAKPNLDRQAGRQTDRLLDKYWHWKRVRLRYFCAANESLSNLSNKTTKPNRPLISKSRVEFNGHFCESSSDFSTAWQMLIPQHPVISIRPPFFAEQLIPRHRAAERNSDLEPAAIIHPVSFALSLMCTCHANQPCMWSCGTGDLRPDG